MLFGRDSFMVILKIQDRYPMHELSPRPTSIFLLLYVSVSVGSGKKLAGIVELSRLTGVKKELRFCLKLVSMVPNLASNGSHWTRRNVLIDNQRRGRPKLSTNTARASLQKSSQSPYKSAVH